MSALRKNVASQVLTFNLVNATTGAALTGATVTTKVALDGTQSAGAGTVTELGTGQYKYVPTQGETNGTSVGFSFTATNAVPVNLHCFTIGQDPTQTTLDVNVTKLLGTAWLTPGTAGTPDVNAKLHGGTSQTGRDIGASVLLSTGTGTGQLDFTSGVVKANLAQILGTALTETAGQIAAGFKKFFNIASPVSTMDVVATVTNLTNAPTAGDLTATMKSSVSTAVNASDVFFIKAKTDNLAFTVASQVDANVLDWKSATAPAMTGDAYARLGAPAGASASADIAAVKVDTAAIKAKTDLQPEGIKKNTALANFEFPMVSSTNHVSGVTGLTVTAERSIDGAAFGACTNSVSEVSNGVYKISLSAADLNGDVITLRFSAATADDRLITIKTSA